MMDYAARLNKSMQQNMPAPVPGQYQLSADNAMVTPEQKSILDMMLGIYNNPGFLANAKSKGPK